MIKKIRTEDLEIGMFVTDFNTPWMNHPFLTSKKRIRGARDVDTIREHGIAEVYIDTARGADSPRAYVPEETEAPAPERAREAAAAGPRVVEAPPDEVPYDEELRRAREVYGQAKHVVQGLFEQVQLGVPVDGEGATETIGRMIESVFRNQDALLSLSRLKSFDEYTFQHSINVAVLCLNLGSRLGILDRELLRLGVGALLHDLGKMRVPSEILQKPGRLDPREVEIVRTHAAHGASLILQCPSLDDDCAAVALNHHERYDGSGYPRSLAGAAVGKFGLITAIADVYDAMTSDRVYQRGTPPARVLQRLYEWAGTHFHPVYTRKFIQCLGIYPVGTTVRLDTEEVAVVVRQNRDDLLRPWVRLVGPPVREVDLRERDPEGRKPHARAVAAVLPSPPPGVDVESLLADPGAAHRQLTVVL